MALDFNSKTYPYQRVASSQNTLIGAEKIPYMVLKYLLDMPDNNGYIPPDNNEYPRCRLAKYLWYDGERPLENELPTPKQKLSLLFDPENPDLSTSEDYATHPKGYRLFSQKVIGQSITEAKTIIKCYVGRIFDSKPFHTTIGLRFDIWTNVNYSSNTKTDSYDRTFAIEQCLRESLVGINMIGVGAISASRYDHADNGSTYIYDDGNNVGRSVSFSIDWVDPSISQVSGLCENC